MDFVNSDIRPELLKKLKEGDMDSFEEIFTFFNQRLFLFVFRYLKSKEEAEEIVQESFLQIWENRANINDKRSFKSYLFTIAKNKIIDYFRKKKVENLYRNYLMNFMEVISNNEYRDLLYKDYNYILTAAIDKLPEKRKIIFIMSKKLGMTRQEIADFFDISEHTVKNQLQEAMDFLRQIMKNEILLFIAFYIQLFC